MWDIFGEVGDDNCGGECALLHEREGGFFDGVVKRVEVKVVVIEVW